MKIEQLSSIDPDLLILKVEGLTDWDDEVLYVSEILRLAIKPRLILNLLNLPHISKSALHVLASGRGALYKLRPNVIVHNVLSADNCRRVRDYHLDAQVLGIGDCFDSTSAALEFPNDRLRETG